MTQIFRSNPFITNRRPLTLPGGSGDPLHTGGTLSTQFFDYRIHGTVIPFMYVGVDLASGKVKLNFLDDKKPFPVSDAIRRHAEEIGVEMGTRYIEAFPDHGIFSSPSGRDDDPIPRYKDANDDPWMLFRSCNVVERVDTEIGELAVGALDAFKIRVGAGTDGGVPGIRMDGKIYRVHHEYVVVDGSVEADTWGGRSLVHDPSEDIGKPSYAELGFSEASRLHKSGEKAPATVSDTVARLSSRVAQDFLERRFHDIRDSVVRMYGARKIAFEMKRDLVIAALDDASPKLAEFHRRRIADFDETIATYNQMIEDLQEANDPGEVSTPEMGADWQYSPRTSGRGYGRR